MALVIEAASNIKLLMSDFSSANLFDNRHDDSNTDPYSLFFEPPASVTSRADSIIYY